MTFFACFQQNVLFVNERRTLFRMKTARISRPSVKYCLFFSSKFKNESRFDMSQH